MKQPRSVEKLHQRHGYCFLFLQGLATPFFAELMSRLTDTGAEVHKMNYCGGDWYFSRKPQSKISTINYRQPQNQLPDFYEDLLTTLKPDAILLFGDCRPIHKTAIAVAARQKIPVFVFEEGYTRPGYITLEKGGTNDRTGLPRSTDALLKRANDIRMAEIQPPCTPTLPNPMPARVRMDLQFHAANILGLPFFRGYKTHRPEKVSDELAGWVKGFFRKRKFKKENADTIMRYEAGATPYFLVPLQLNSDYQIREHSPYRSVPEFIKETITSYKHHAPAGANLLFKAHPLDNGIIDYRTLIRDLAETLGCADRVNYMEGGSLDVLLKNCTGCVMINSTVGYAALQNGTPIKVMGRAIYDIEGLSDQKPLNDFWQTPEVPQKALVDDFIMVVRHDTQVYGDYFTEPGIKLAADGAAERLIKAIQE